MENTEKIFGKINNKNCPVRRALDVVGGKWAITIIYSLFEGTKRFKELERSIEGINTRMLVKELKLMEEHKILERVAYATIPPTVEYSLTDKGRSLKPVLEELYKWGKDFY
jgi:DNA-binding HxlR family transcriptional regulator